MQVKNAEIRTLSLQLITVSHILLLYHDVMTTLLRYEWNINPAALQQQ
jgi:hypothetical protein